MHTSRTRDMCRLFGQIRQFLLDIVLNLRLEIHVRYLQLPFEISAAFGRLLKM